MYGNELHPPVTRQICGYSLELIDQLLNPTNGKRFISYTLYNPSGIILFAGAREVPAHWSTNANETFVSIMIPLCNPVDNETIDSLPAHLRAFQLDFNRTEILYRCNRWIDGGYNQ